MHESKNCYLRKEVACTSSWQQRPACLTEIRIIVRTRTMGKYAASALPNSILDRYIGLQSSNNGYWSAAYIASLTSA